MKNALAITLTILSVAAFGAHAGLTANNQGVETYQTELAVKAIGNGAISFGMSANQIEKAIS
ncbi:hypothetical protein H2O73_03640 [Vibrio sp. 404]|uniref:Uncharacterized protein n=1 Tax=Vibrio marinisediminis TaxID=2758441 RepID=A0A7W2FNL8_9VIBR|nr:hypothetical protein [Vibrio marinisediminis]MBA5761428.1 hypothetical protein [Vibrio marinisediminis]